MLDFMEEHSKIQGETVFPSTVVLKVQNLPKKPNICFAGIMLLRCVISDKNKSVSLSGLRLTKMVPPGNSVFLEKAFSISVLSTNCLLQQLDRISNNDLASTAPQVG